MKIVNNILQKIILVVILVVIVIFLNHISGAGINHLNLDTQDLAFERILFVPGINTPGFYLNRWQKDLVVNFPDKEIIFLDGNVYLYWQDEKTEEIVEKGVEILNDGKPTLVIAHSYGGILAKTMIVRAESAKVVELITMASPHQMNLFGIDDNKEFLEAPAEVDVPIYSFGGYVDPVVLFPWTEVDGKDNHQDLWSGHSGFLFNKDVRRKVLEYAFDLKTKK